MRPIISYDDITTPISPEQGSSAQIGPHLPPSHQRPTKRRRSNQKVAAHKRQIKHWDDPSQSTSINSHDAVSGGATEIQVSGNETMQVGEHTSRADEKQQEREEETMSRELTHEEIWDDSALIDAWNSATAEYEAFHGKRKKWKDEPIKKSPLWYNVPPASKPKPHSTVQNGTENGHQGISEEDSEPLNFDTFVPSHDPSLAQSALAAGVPRVDDFMYNLPDPSGPMVSQDEAFQRALSAMYWGGYWTAVYHCQRQVASNSQITQGEGEEDGDSSVPGGEQGDDDDPEDLIPTQR